MGSGRDKRKKKPSSTASAGKGRAKTERKTMKNQAKKERRLENMTKGGEDDIDALLAQVDLEESRKSSVRVQTNSDAPSPRCHCSFVPIPSSLEKKSQSSDSVRVVLFGGERQEMRSDKVIVYKDLHYLDVETKTKMCTWTRVDIPKGPQPRSSHQSVHYKGSVYVFGGEFTSLNQERFMHFKDLWRLDLDQNLWENLPIRGGPSARSGHRMILHEDKLILFGGFQDTGKKIKYFNDLWSFDLSTLKWETFGPSADSSLPMPSPRSAANIAVYENTLYLYGGYYRAEDEDDAEIERGRLFKDMWTISLDPRRGETARWEKIKADGLAPGLRAGNAMVVDSERKRWLLFGGVEDHEAKGGEALVSVFHRDLYAFSFEKRRWQPLPVSYGNVAASSYDQSGDVYMNVKSRGNLTPEEEEKEKAAVRIQATFRGYTVRKAYQVYKLGGQVSELLYSPAVAGVVAPKNVPRPTARMNTLLAVSGKRLLLYGGVFESGDNEITLDDLWGLDLARLDGWKLYIPATVDIKKYMDAADAAGEDSSDEGWEEDDDDDDDDD